MVNYEVKIYVDSLCLLIFGVICLYVVLDKKNKTKLSQYFVHISIFSMLMILGDLLNWANSGHTGKLSYFLVWSGLIIYYCSTGFLVYSLILYIGCIMQRHGNVSKIFAKTGLVIALICLGISISSIFSKAVFYVSDDNLYKRGPLYIATQFPMFMYLLIVVMMIIYRKLLTKSEAAFIIIYTFLPTVGEFIQLFIPGTTTFIPGLTVAIIILFMYVQNEKRFQESEDEKNEIDNARKSIEQSRDLREKQLFQSMETILSIVEKRELCTNGHARRVGNYTREIAHRMGLDEEYQIEAYYAGLFHDIGMIEIPEEIINKKTELTDEERELVKIHTTSAFHILGKFESYPLIRDAARWHHERMDGKGYPNGLKGENIPLIARIVAVADAYDAMTSNRPYREKLAKNMVEDQFTANAGIQFDPKIVDIMLDMMKADTYFEMQEMVKNVEESILVIDDDVVIHNLIEEALNDESYSVTCAQSGQEAINLMKVEEFSVCLLDLEMPGMNGLEVLNWINSNNKKIKVVFMTETRDIDTIRKVQKLGATDYITKPVSFKTLKNCIKSVLSY